MPRTQKQFEEIRENKRALIKETALELFAVQGYHQASISQIAKKAGISKGLMYNYFKSKETLMSEIISEGIDEMMGAFDPNKDGVLTDEEFEFFVKEIFQILKKNQNYWRLYFGVIVQPVVFKMIQPKLQVMIPQIINTLSAYYESKGAKDPMGEAMLFGSLMDGIAFNYMIDTENFPLENTIDLIIEKFSYNHKTSE